jgi:uncharacterized integral membrane protein
MQFTTDLVFFFVFIAGTVMGLLIMYGVQLSRISDYQDEIEKLHSIILNKNEKVEKK